MGLEFKHKIFVIIELGFNCLQLPEKNYIKKTNQELFNQLINQSINPRICLKIKDLSTDLCPRLWRERRCSSASSIQPRTSSRQFIHPFRLSRPSSILYTFINSFILHTQPTLIHPVYLILIHPTLKVCVSKPNKKIPYWIKNTRNFLLYHFVLVCKKYYYIKPVTKPHFSVQVFFSNKNARQFSNESFPTVLGFW